MSHLVPCWYSKRAAWSHYLAAWRSQRTDWVYYSCFGGSWSQTTWDSSLNGSIFFNNSFNLIISKFLKRSNRPKKENSWSSFLPVSDIGPRCSSLQPQLRYWDIEYLGSLQTNKSNLKRRRSRWPCPSSWLASRARIEERAQTEVTQSRSDHNTTEEADCKGDAY